MRLLDRYLLRELLVPLGYCLSGFLIFWVAFDGFRKVDDFQKEGLLLRDIVEYYFVQTPEILALILPVALLLALLYTLTNHARHHELTAIRGAGIGLWRLSLPYLAVGLALSLVSFALNELLVPDGAEAAKRIEERHQPPKAGALRPGEVCPLYFKNEREGRVWSIGVFDTVTGEMRNPVVFCPQAGGSCLELHAKRAARVDGVWTFYDVWELEAAANTNSWPVPVLETNVLAVPAFSETVEQIKSEIKIGNSIALPGSTKTKRPDMSIAEILDYLRLHPDPPPNNRALLYTKLEGRLAAPWTCVVVVLIAIPFGAASGRRNVFVGVASSIVICFTYFVLQQLTLALGTGGYLPPWLAGWLPNLSFGLAGLGLTARAR